MKLIQPIQLIAILLVCALTTTDAGAQTAAPVASTPSLPIKSEPAAPAAANSWQPGLDQINEKSVTSTITFLASDEMAGRGTPSPEYLIASAYVAARFRGAGLQPGGTEGTFYQNSAIKSIKTPSQGVVFEINGEAVAPAGMLGAADNPVEFSGETPLVDWNGEWQEGAFSGPVAVNVQLEPDTRGNRAVSQVIRKLNLLRQAGATALIAGVDADSPLLAQAETYRQKARPDNANLRFGIPVLLIPGKIESVDGKLNGVSLKLPAQEVEEVIVRNVIGVLPGSDENLAAEALIFSAHLDHLGRNPQLRGDQIFNGADDNATGCTAVVSLADAFAALPERPQRSILFICFWGEESGLLGSAQYAKNSTWPLDKIVANINIEMIGRPEAGAREKVWVTGWSESNLGELMNQASQAVGVEIFQHPNFSAMLYRSSDNWSFVQQGVIAHSFSAGSLHGDYHQVTDEWELLDIPHMTRVIQGLFVGSLPMARGEVKPTKPKK